MGSGFDSQQMLIVLREIRCIEAQTRVPVDREQRRRRVHRLRAQFVEQLPAEYDQIDPAYRRQILSNLVRVPRPSHARGALLQPNSQSFAAIAAEKERAAAALQADWRAIALTDALPLREEYAEATLMANLDPKGALALFSRLLYSKPFCSPLAFASAENRSEFFEQVRLNLFFLEARGGSAVRASFIAQPILKKMQSLSVKTAVGAKVWIEALLVIEKLIQQAKDGKTEAGDEVERVSWTAAALRTWNNLREGAQGLPSTLWNKESWSSQVTYQRAHSETLRVGTLLSRWELECGYAYEKKTLAMPGMNFVGAELQEVCLTQLAGFARKSMLNYDPWPAWSLDLIRNLKNALAGGSRQGSQLLLEGPPGRGKTTFVLDLLKYVELSSRASNAVECGWLGPVITKHIRQGMVFNGHFDGSRSKVADLLSELQQSAVACNGLALVFLDEADQYFRNSPPSGEAENDRITYGWSDWLDGSRKENKLFFLAATNDTKKFAPMALNRFRPVKFVELPSVVLKIVEEFGLLSSEARDAAALLMWAGLSPRKIKEECDLISPRHNGDQRARSFHLFDFALRANPSLAPSLFETGNNNIVVDKQDVQVTRHLLHQDEYLKALNTHSAFDPGNVLPLILGISTVSDFHIVWYKSRKKLSFRLVCSPQSEERLGFFACEAFTSKAPLRLEPKAGKILRGEARPAKAGVFGGLMIVSGSILEGNSQAFFAQKYEMACKPYLYLEFAALHATSQSQPRRECLPDVEYEEDDVA